MQGQNTKAQTYLLAKKGMGLGHCDSLPSLLSFLLFQGVAYSMWLLDATIAMISHHENPDLVERMHCKQFVGVPDRPVESPAPGRKILI